MAIILILVLLFIGLFLYFLWVSFYGWVPYKAMPQPIVKKMLKLAKISSNDVLYDLGSGDGRIVICAVRDFGAKKAVGIEISFGRFLISSLKIHLAGLSKKAKIFWGNYFKKDLKEATVVSLYLIQKVNDKLVPKLARELPQNARVVSYKYTLPAPLKLVAKDSKQPIYLYQKKG